MYRSSAISHHFLVPVLFVWLLLYSNANLLTFIWNAIHFGIKKNRASGRGREDDRGSHRQKRRMMNLYVWMKTSMKASILQTMWRLDNLFVSLPPPNPSLNLCRQHINFILLDLLYSRCSWKTNCQKHQNKTYQHFCLINCICCPV